MNWNTSYSNQVLKFDLTKVALQKPAVLLIYQFLALRREKRKIKKKRHKTAGKYLIAINNCSHYLQINSTLSDLWQGLSVIHCADQRITTRGWATSCFVHHNRTKKPSLAQARHKLLSAQKHQDWKRSDSTMEVAPIEQDKVCCGVMACLSYHRSKDSGEGGEHCCHEAMCSAAAGWHRGCFGTNLTDVSEGFPLQWEAEGFAVFIFTADALLKDGS